MTPSVRLLFLHGGLANGGVWREQCRAFGGRFICDTPDLPGHGENAAAPLVSAAELADRLVRTRGDSLVVIGHSVGGLIALEVARRHPTRVLGVVTLESPVVPPAGFAERSRAMLAALDTSSLEAWASRMVPGSSPYRDEIAAMMHATPPEAARWAIRLAHEYDTESALRGIEAPILVVDGLVDPARLRAVQPRARRDTTECGSHYVQLDCAEAVNERLEAFLSVVTAAGRDRALPIVRG